MLVLSILETQLITAVSCRNIFSFWCHQSHTVSACTH